MTIIAISTLLLTMIFLPFIPVIIELLFPEDKLPLKVNLLFSKNPRFFGISFRKKLGSALSSLPQLNKKGKLVIKLSKNEIIKFIGNRKLKSPLKENVLIYFNGNGYIPPHSELEKEVFVENNAIIGKGSKLRAIACNGDCITEENVEIARWIDCEGKIDIKGNSKIGVVASTPKSISLGKGTVFTRIFGNPVKTYNISPIKKPVIEISGDIKVSGDLKIDKGEFVLIKGSIFSDKDIFINKAEIDGNIFSFGKVRLKNCKIGNSKRTVSVIGSEGISLGENTSIYGYVQTEYLKGKVE